MNKRVKLVSIVLLITILSNLVFMPEVARAQSAVPPEIAAVTDSGERFMTAAPLAIGNALELAQRLEVINQTNYADLTEEMLVEARDFALQAAQQAAIAQGGLGAMVNSLEELEYQTQAAGDMDDIMADLQANGFSAEVETAFLDAGLTITQVATLESEVSDKFYERRDVGQNGFLTETVTTLQDAGLTITDVEQLEETFSGYGVAAAAPDSRLAQLRATQEELSLARNNALIAYVQLLSRQVFWQESNGESGREVTESELDMLVQDQLRLLIHIGYLDDLWGNGADPDAGEGQWLFVERYSQRVVERMDSLILDTQNVGLTVDLFIALQVHTVALVAQAGDAAYAQAELDNLGDSLAALVGDDLPGGQAARQAEPSFVWRVALYLGELTSFRYWDMEELSPPETEVAALEVGKNQLRGRLARFAALPLASGSVDESDETNNTDIMVFYASPAGLSPELTAILSQYLPDYEEVLEMLWGVVSGQTDNPYLIGINIVLSFSPVLGFVFDLIALFTEDSGWGKFFALAGLLSSILTDGVALLGLFVSWFPPSWAATGTSVVVLKAVDVGSAIMKGIRAFISPQAWDFLKQIPFAEMKKLGSEILIQLTRKAIDVVGGIDNWPSSLSDVINLLQSIKNYVIGPLIALVTRFADNLSKLYTWGFGDGGFLLGRILHLSDEAATYSDEAYGAVVRYGDEALGEAASELSDEAAEGLGRLASILDEGQFNRIADAIRNSCVAATPLSKTRLAKPTNLQVCDPVLLNQVLTNIRNWDAAATGGFQNLAKRGLGDERLAQILTNYANNPDTLKTALGYLDGSNVDLVKTFGIRVADDADGFVALVGRGYIKQDLERIVRTVYGQSPATAELVEQQILALPGQTQSYLRQALAQIDSLGVRFKVVGNDPLDWTSRLDISPVDHPEILNPRRFQQDDLVHVGAMSQIENRGGFIGQDYNIQVFNQRLSLGIPATEVHVGGGTHVLDAVYSRGSEIIPVEVKNYTSLDSFTSAWNPTNEVGKAVAASLEYGDNMEMYVFHFTDDKFYTGILPDLQNRFQAQLPNVQLIVVHGQNPFPAPGP